MAYRTNKCRRVVNREEEHGACHSLSRDNQKEVNCVEVIHSQGPKQVLKAEASQNYESGSGVSPVQIVDCVGHSPTRTI
ncbi:hypothetical protein SCA6_013037 [Theobroma cacao]